MKVIKTKEGYKLSDGGRVYAAFIFKSEKEAQDFIPRLSNAHKFYKSVKHNV